MKLYDSIPRPLLSGNDVLSNVMYDDIDYRINDVGETINFTFFDIRIKRNPDAELYIDNNCLFYNYFRMVCVNQGLMNINDFSNISVTYDELRELCKGKIETFSQYRYLDGLKWEFKYKKGDNDGE